MVRAVVVNWNGGRLVEQCVASLLASVGAFDLQVVVVDNASTDGSVERLATTADADDRVTVVRNRRNEGFVAANAGMRPLPGLVDPDAVALVNPDATVASDCLARLLDELVADPSLGATSPLMLFAHRFVDVALSAPPVPGLRDPRALAVCVRSVEVDGVERLGGVAAVSGVHDPEEDAAGPFRWLGPDAILGVPVPLDDGGHTVTLTLTAPVAVDAVVDGVTVPVGPTPTVHQLHTTGIPVDRIANAGSIVFDDGAGADRGHFAAVAPPFDAPDDLFTFCGGGVLLRWAFLRDVGVFDPSLFLYYEDTDLAWRGKARAWRYRFVPDARMRHVQGASAGARSDRFVVSTTRNRLVVAVRNAPWRVVRRAWSATLSEVWSSAVHEVAVPIAARRRPTLRMFALRCRGLLAAVGALPGALVARRRLGRRATVPRATVAVGLIPRN